MSKPWMPLYVGDYLKKTAHLGALESGAYLHLIMNYWANGKLPTNEQQLARIAKVSDKEWSLIKDTISAFFVDGWRHERIDEELAHAEDVSNKRKAARAQRSNNSSTIVEQKTTQSQSQSQSKKEDIRAVANATRPDDRFLEFWEAYPKRDGANPKEPARKKFAALIKSGVDPGAIIAGAGRYAVDMRARVQENTPYVAQAVTWLNQQRWGD
jgi:uncharacterized protein YdaU (DUF1376 family)